MVTDFTLAPDSSSGCQNCGNGVLLGQFDIQTRKANGNVQRLSQGGVGNRFSLSKAQLGSGYICGFNAFSGHKIDAFGLIFLRKFQYGYWVEPKAYLPDNASVEPDNFQGRFFCPAPGNQTCTNALSYQSGFQGSITTQTTVSTSWAGFEEVSIGVEAKDLFKFQVTAAARQENSLSSSTINIATSTFSNTDTSAYNCLCPMGELLPNRLLLVHFAKA